MTQLAKEYFDRHLKKLPTKQDVREIVESQVRPLKDTFNRTTALVANLVEDFREFHKELKNVPSILDSPTTLDAIYKSTGHWKTETQALRSAIKRHEEWINQIAEKLNLKLES